MAASDTKNIEDIQNELKWVTINKASTNLGETFMQKLKRKSLEDPIVPLGASATVAALTVGIINLVKKNSRKQQIMMRYRIIAQGITFAALGYSVFFYQLKKFF